MLDAGGRGTLILSEAFHRGGVYTLLSYTGSAFLETQWSGQDLEGTGAWEKMKNSWTLSSFPQTTFLKLALLGHSPPCPRCVQLFLPTIPRGMDPPLELYPGHLRPNSKFCSWCHITLVLEKDVVSEPEEADEGLPQHPWLVSELRAGLLSRWQGCLPPEFLL